MAALGVDGRLSGRRLDESPVGTVVRAGVRRGPAATPGWPEPPVPLAPDHRLARKVLATSLYDDPAAGLCGDTPAGLDEHPEHGL